MKEIIDSLRWKDGFIDVVITDSDKNVLMLVQMDKESFAKTVETGFVHYFSPVKFKPWKKGNSSGHTQKVLSIKVDCDNDALLISVEPSGGACHKGYHGCFYRKLNGKQWENSEKPEFDPRLIYPEFIFKG